MVTTWVLKTYSKTKLVFILKSGVFKWEENNIPTFIQIKFCLPEIVAL